MFPCIACHFPISLCQILHLATINVIIVTKVAGGNPIEFLLPEPSGTALFIFIQKQPLCRPSSQTVGVDLCIERFHHRLQMEQQDFLPPGQGVLVFPNQMHGLKTCGTRSESALYLRAGFLPLFSDSFSRTKSPPAMTLPSPPCQAQPYCPAGLKTLAAAMEKDRPTPSDVVIYAEGVFDALLAGLLPSLPLQVRKKHR